MLLTPTCRQRQQQWQQQQQQWQQERQPGDKI
jgi:hypothetical protein